MNPLFRLSNLSRLPPKLKADANKALRGSQAEMAAAATLLIQKLENATLPKQHLLHFLPVFYTAIGTTDNLEASVSAAFERPETLAEFASRAQRATFAIRGLFSVYRRHREALSDALAELAPRILDWIIFHDDFWPVWPLVGPEFERRSYVYRSHLEDIDILLGAPSTRAMVLQDSRVPVFVGSAWRCIVDGDEGGLDPGPQNVDPRLHGLHKIIQILGHYHDRITKSYVQSLASGAGGVDTLGRLLVAVLPTAFPSPTSEATSIALETVSSFPFFCDRLVAGGVPYSSLFHANIVTHVLVVARAQQNAPRGKIPAEFGNQSEMLVCYAATLAFRHAPVGMRTSLFVEALRADFLATAFHSWRASTFTQLPTSRHNVERSVEHIDLDMPRGLSSRAVIRQLRDCNLDELPSTLFVNQRAGRSWGALLDVMGRRIFNLETSTSETKRDSALGGCDNIECGKIHPQRALKRCAGCRQMNYCSRACQKAAWERGHRQLCNASSRHRLRVEIGIESLSFARTIMNDTFSYNAVTMFLNFLTFFVIHEDPDHVPCLVVTHLIRGCEFQCVIRVECNDCNPALGRLYPEEVMLARASAGRFRLHFLGGFSDGETAEHYALLPFYAPQGGELYTAVRALALKIRGSGPIRMENFNGDAYSGHIEALLKRYGTHPETH
ncbi:MYND-type domain-containing protein [Mycena kentingensis (nom. inval.)]|nr:MYND-type domain-containing protein [Mycena kentingensis (nom. inval.)]